MHDSVEELRVAVEARPDCREVCARLLRGRVLWDRLLGPLDATSRSRVERALEYLIMERVVEYNLMLSTGRTWVKLTPLGRSVAAPWKE